MSQRHQRRGAYRADWLPSWPEYARLHGIDLPDNGREERRMACTIHGGTRDSLCVNVKSGAWQCKACGAGGGDVLAHYMALHGAQFVEAAKALGAWEDEDTDGNPVRPSVETRAPQAPVNTAEDQRRDDWKRERAAAIWQASKTITAATPIGAYFHARGVPFPQPDGDLRWLPNLQLFGFSGPALVGRMSLADDYRQGRGLHLTWLQLDDAGAWRRHERRYLGPKKGCVVRLWPDDAVGTGLAISEGIETGLALAHAYRPVWACMDAGNLADFPVLEGVESLLIAADHDSAGIAAAETCAQRWADAGREAGIVMAPTPGHDIADLAASEAV